MSSALLSKLSTERQLYASVSIHSILFCLQYCAKLHIPGNLQRDTGYAKQNALTGAKSFSPLTMITLIRPWRSSHNLRAGVMKGACSHQVLPTMGHLTACRTRPFCPRNI